MYIDGFLVPVPSDKKAEYVRIARQAAEVFKEHGATQVIEAWGDDVPVGTLTSFTRAVQLEEGETVVFSWITYPDRATRTPAWRRPWPTLGCSSPCKACRSTPSA